MKPRLESTPLTVMDQAIWHDVGLRFRPIAGSHLIDASQSADRRDADIMYGIAVAKEYERTHAARFVEWRGRAWAHSLVEVALTTPVLLRATNIIYFA